MPPSRDVVWHDYGVDKAKRRALNGHASKLVWFTGLSGAGKSTIAQLVEEELHRRGVHTYILDGDNVRHGLNADLGFSDDDRRENIRRAGEVGRLLVDAGLVVLATFISPFSEDRRRVRHLFADGDFVEVYVRCDLDTCRRRDPKGLYAKAHAGAIANFTGIDSPYEEPQSPDLIVDTSSESAEQAAQRVIDLLDL
jgi:adenylylsulfate kinase